MEFMHGRSSQLAIVETGNIPNGYLTVKTDLIPHCAIKFNCSAKDGIIAGKTENSEVNAIIASIFTPLNTIFDGEVRMARTIKIA